MTYKTFIRDWWKDTSDPSWPNGLEPCAGKRNYTGEEFESKQEAKEACQQWNKQNKPGRYSRKMEFE